MKKIMWVMSIVIVFSLTLGTVNICLAAEKKVELIMQVRTGPEASGSRKLAEYWNERYAGKTGIYVKQVDTSRSGYYTKINNILFSGVKTPDIVLSYNNFIPLYVTAGAVVDITDWWNDDQLYPYDRDDFFPIMLDLVRYKGRMYGLPTDSGTYYLFYRKDLIPSPPQTYDELFEVAKKFTQKYNSNSPTKYGLAFYGRREESTAMFWYQIFKSYGGDFFDKELRPQFNSEAGVKALEWIQKCIKAEVTPPDISTYEYMEILGALQTGKVATGIQWSAAVPTVTSKESSPLIWDKIAITLSPGVRQPEGSIKRAQSAHALLFAINAHSRHKKEAFQFLAWATGAPEALRIYALECQPPHFSIYNDPEMQKVNLNYTLQDKALVKYGYVEPPLPDYPEVKDILTSYLLRAWSLEIPAKQALDEANKAIYEALENKGYYK